MAQFRDLVLRIKTLGLDKDLKLDTITDQNLEDIDDYLKEIEENKTPFGLHTFGVSPDEAYTKATTEAIVSMQKDLMGKRFGTFQGAGTKEYRKIGERRIGCFYPGFEWKVCPAGTGNDPIRNPGALPTGKNFFAFDPRLIPSRMTCRLGEQLAEELIEQYKAEHNGECPPKVTINLWAVECIRNEGTMEAQALSLLGVRPVYNASNRYPVWN